MRRRDPFDVLDLSLLATLEEARAAYRRLAAIFHPDRFADAREDVQAEAAKQMAYVNEAWRSLEARLRAETAADRADRQAAAAAAEAQPAPSPERTRRATPEGPDPFSSRARHARTKQRAWQKSAEGAKQRAGQRQSDVEAEREAFVREARQRLAEEEAARQAGDAGSPARNQVTADPG